MRKLITLMAVAAMLVAAPAASAAKAPTKNIVEVAASTGQFDTLISLAKDAGLAGTLTSKGPFTVFAPTDKAFSKVPKSTLRSLKRDKAALRRVLLYHVLAGRYGPKRLIKAGSVATVAGPKVKIRLRGKTVRVNRAKVIKANVRASNGVIHVVNSVLIPPSK